MHKFRNIILCLAACVILLAIGSCNLPFFTPATPTSTPESEEPEPDPVAPANTDGAETIRIPGGTFLMGSAESDTQADEDERPVHQVSVGTFYLYTHEVTNEMYAACAAAGACLPVNEMDSGPTTHYSDDAYAEYPVVGVDWNMARSYCTWAGGRLPTEAEWEYAARGTESLLYPWGAEEPACDRVNMLGCSVPPDVVAVGSYLLGNSPFEVWDLSGNVWEWVNDWYAEGYYALSPAVDPLGPYAPVDAYHPLKVVRGGGLYAAPEQMRSAARAGTSPYRAYDDVGFRCVAEGENLPEEYTETRERHEMVPPDPLDGGGETLEEPEDEIPYVSMGASNATCPDDAGNITLYLEVESSEVGEYFVTVDDIPFTCTYDEGAHLLTCTGPQPAATEYPDEYHVQIHFPGGGIIGHQYPEIPTDCPVGFMEPFILDVSASCPEAGWVTVNFHFEPSIVWESTRYLEGLSYVDMPCWPLGANQMNCIVPARLPGDTYSFSLHGVDSSGMGYVAYSSAAIPVDCAMVERGTSLEPFCFEGQPTVHVNFVPAGFPPSSVSTFGVPLGCIGMTVNDQYCGPLPGTAGSDTVITTCFPGEPCQARPLTIPDCSGPGVLHFLEMLPGCYESLGPVVVIHYAPADSPLVSAGADGVALTCLDDAVPGWYMCSGLPGAPGTSTTIDFCLADGTCMNDTISTPDCSEAPPSSGFRLAAIGCASETNIYFIVDTDLAWLVPGAHYTYAAEDGVTGYSCTVHPTIPGRLYCAAARPDSPGPLQVCVQQDGAPAPTCQTFTDYPAWIAGLPPCVEEPEPVEPDPEPVDPCSVHTDEFSCNTDKPACRWIYTSPQHCESNP